MWKVRREVGGWAWPSDGLDLDAPARPRVVVFDVDNVLCVEPLQPVPEGEAPEVLRVGFSYQGYEFTYAFIPHVGALLAQLVAWGCRVCFFSSGLAERNHEVLGEVLARSFAAEELARLRGLGQFAIHSRDQLRDADPDAGEDGNKVKDMRRVLRAGETLEDVVLIEDQPSYVASGQAPCLPAIDIGLWNPGWEVGRDREFGSQGLHRKNGAAWMLGVFDLLLHDVRYRYRPLRLGLDRLLCDLFGATRRPEPEPSPARHGVILRGLAHLWAIDPGAVFYGQPWRRAEF
jgi:hypothetical protein